MSEIKFSAQTGKQEMFLNTAADIAIYGGARGGGKTYALLLEGMRYTRLPGFSCVMFRRTFPQVEQEDGLLQTSKKIYPYFKAQLHSGKMVWTFPSGTTVRFSHMENPDDKLAWLGASIPLICFDELVTFEEQQFWFMMGTNRSTCGVLPYIRCTTNPQADSWVARLIEWFWDPDTGYPIEERAGVLRWFVRIEDQLIWGNSKEELLASYPESMPISLTFIPAKVFDNKILLEKDPMYLGKLQSMSRVDRERYLGGNWKISESASNYFKRHWFSILPEAPTGLTNYVRYWDVAATEPHKKNKDPDWTAGVLLSMKDGIWYVLHVERFRGRPAEVEARIRRIAESDPYGTKIRMEQEPGSPIWDQEMVTIHNGSMKRLKDISVGDRVIDKDGQPSIVKAVHVQGDLECREIKTDSGRSVIAAPSHLFLTPHGWKQCGDLIEGDILALRCKLKLIPKPRLRKLEEFRLAGYFIGDGCCTKTGNSCNAMITCSDKLQAKDVRDCVNKIGFSIKAGGVQGWHYRIRNGIRNWLRDTGLFGIRTEDKHVPDWVMSSDDECVAHFLGAYFACDGSVTERPHNTSVEFYSISKRLLTQVQSLLLRFGISSRLRVREYRKSRKRLNQTNQRDLYRLSLRASDDSQSRFAQKIPVFGIKIKRLSKFRRTDFDRDVFADKIISVTNVGKKPCRCLTVEGGESFLVHDLIVHNSGVGMIDHYARYVLTGFNFKGVPTIKNKQLRAGPFSAASEAGNVKLIRGPWNMAYLDELENFRGLDEKNDQVDGSTGAMGEFTGNKGDWKFALPVNTTPSHSPLAIGHGGGYQKIGF